MFRRDQAIDAVMVADDLTDVVPSPDGTFIVGRRPDVGFVCVNADGSRASVVVEDALGHPYAFTPDGTALLYGSNKSGPQQPWLLQLDTGATRRLSEAAIGSQMSLSPDGRQVLFATGGVTQLCAFPEFDRCRTLKIPAGLLSADGQTVFAVDPGDGRNLVAQPIDGGPALTVTKFADKEIGDFLSRDRSRIVITRRSQLSDVVLIKGLQPEPVDRMKIGERGHREAGAGLQRADGQLRALTPN